MSQLGQEKPVGTPDAPLIGWLETTHSTGYLQVSYRSSLFIFKFSGEEISQLIKEPSGIHSKLNKPAFPTGIRP